MFIHKLLLYFFFLFFFCDLQMHVVAGQLYIFTSINRKLYDDLTLTVHFKTCWRVHGRLQEHHRVKYQVTPNCDPGTDSRLKLFSDPRTWFKFTLKVDSPEELSGDCVHPYVEMQSPAGSAIKACLWLVARVVVTKLSWSYKNHEWRRSWEQSVTRLWET